jgi:hypothetical protein
MNRCIYIYNRTLHPVSSQPSIELHNNETKVTLGLFSSSMGLSINVCIHVSKIEARCHKTQPGERTEMNSIRCYNHIVLAAVIFSVTTAITGIVLLSMNHSIPGTICLIVGIVIGLIAGMEWRCRERSTPIFFVNSRPESVSIAVQPPLKTQYKVRGS